MMAALLACVDARLREVLGGDAPAYLRKGEAWQELPSVHSSSPRGSRHDHMVAFLCGVGVRQVQSCRASSKAARAEEGEALPRAPAVRGVKPCEAPARAAEAMPCPAAGSAHDAPDEEVRRWGPLGWRVLAKVPGHYVRASVENPQAHATALVLGRTFAMCAVHNIPDMTCQKMLAQLHLAGVDLGQKHHSRDAISAYTGVLARLSLQSRCEGFWTPPRNLQFPSAWRLVFDGVTLPHGVTVTVVLVVFTSSEGEIETAFLGCSRCGPSSVGSAQAATIKEVLDEALQLSTRKARCRGSAGLPLEPVGALASVQGQTEVARGNFLCCIPCDRAYCGRTGTKADLILGEHLGLRDVFGRVRRVGMADSFHCYDTCGKVVWGKGVDKAFDSNDEESDSSGDESPLAPWTRLLRRLRRTLGRGRGNYHLLEAYKKHGVRGHPKVGVPGATRMVVGSNQYLRQSFAHFAPRYEAVSAFAAHAGIMAGQASSSRARHLTTQEQLHRLGAKLANAQTIMLAMLSHLCLSWPEGFLDGALHVQTTAEVFFPVHLRNRQVHWSLKHLSALPCVVARFAHNACSVAAETQQRSSARACWRCNICGLILPTNQALLSHLRELHLNHAGEMRRSSYTETQFFERTKLLRKEREVLPRCAPFSPPVHAEGRSPIMCLAARQRGARPRSLWEMQGIVETLGSLLEFAVFADDAPCFPAGPRAGAGPAPGPKDCFRWLFAVLGSAQLVSLWRGARMFWSFLSGFVAAGCFKGCELGHFGKTDLSIAIRAGTRQRAPALRGCRLASRCVRSVREHFAALPAAFDEQVVRSHGDHIPLRVRDSATVLFWLPEVLEWCRQEDVSTAGWKVAYDCVPVVLAYVANQLSMFDWPNTKDAMLQFRRLVVRWAQLLDDREIQQQVYVRPVPCPIAGSTKYDWSAFSWKAWWKLAHTDPRFVPHGLEGAFALFHFTGMFGISEAYAESVASLLKRYSPRVAARLGTDRIIEKAALRLAGVAGDGTDDLLILRAWADFFGGLQPDRFGFVRKRKARSLGNFPWGAGSLVLHRILKRNQVSGRWRRASAIRQLRIAAPEKKVAKQWLKKLRRQA